MVHRSDKLRGFEDGESEPGELYWSVGFYPKLDLNPEKKPQADDYKKDNECPEHFQRNPGHDMKDVPSAVDSREEAKALDHPPDPDYPSVSRLRLLPRGG